MSSTQSPRPELLSLILHRLAQTEGRANQWFTLEEFRNMPLLRGVRRDVLDQALTHMFVARTVDLIPESNQKTLTEAQREAALWLGGRYLHLIALPN